MATALVTSTPSFTPPSRAPAWWKQFALLCLLLCAATSLLAANVPTGFTDRQLYRGLTSPTAMAALPDNRLLIVQQNGQVLIAKNDAVLSPIFYQVANVDSVAEHGCLGVVADPGFSSNHFLYFYCTVRSASGSNNRVLRVTEANDRIVAGSERVIIDLPNVPAGTNFHMGGGLAFGSDGKLYIAVGNHEDSPQPFASSTSQRLESAFGKILRINADGTVPSDNPFYSNAGAYQPVWALGLRNPYSIAAQPGSGLIFINDVGQNNWEEVNRNQRGANYGWPAAEGNVSDSRFVNPVHAYQHVGGACSLTGGAFYNPASAQFPARFAGRYFFADFCTGQIRSIDPASPATSEEFASAIGNPIALTVTPAGELYYVARNQGTGTPAPGAGTLGKIGFSTSQSPAIVAEPQPQTVLVGTAATFSVSATGVTSYQWFRNGVAIGGATAPSYTTPPVTLADSGATFRVRVSSADRSLDSRSVLLSVTTNRPPVARIDAPAVGGSFGPGEPIAYSGAGIDPEDGNLPPASLAWDVDFQHDAHAHDFLAPPNGAGGSFVATPFEAGEANSWIRIRLTATDSMGVSATASRDVFMKKQITDFTPVGTVANGWGPIENNRSNGETGASDGRTITLDTIAYPRGLGVHAPSEVIYNLAGACSGSFISDVGVDDESGNLGSVVFQVYLDGVKAYDSGLVRGADARRRVSVGVAGRQQMRLIVNDGGDGKDFDHADWAGARVTGCGAAQPVGIANLQVADNANAADWSVRSDLQVNNQAYGDRAYTFASIPGNLVGAQWIRTANDSKFYTGAPLASFTLNAAADIYIGLDNRTGVPAWVDDSWADTSTDITTRESNNVIQTFSVFRKRFDAGTVTLGPWNAPTSVYMVIVR